MRSIQADINATSSSGRGRDIPAGQPRCWRDAEKGVKWISSGNTGMWGRFHTLGKSKPENAQSPECLACSAQALVERKGPWWLRNSP